MKLEDLKPLQEMNVIAAWGDWKLGPVTISYITKQVINLKYEQVGEIKLTSGIKKILKLS